MIKSERVCTYGLLSAVLACNVMMLSGRADRSVRAEPAGPVADDVGPAEALVLTGGDDDLRVRAAEGRIAWGENAHARAYSLALVSLGDVLPKVLETDDYDEERVLLRQELEEQNSELRERLQAIEARAEGLDPNGPEFRAIQEEYAAARQEFMTWAQTANARQAQLAAEQFERAYREAVAAVEVVAQNLDVDLVLRFIPTAEDFNAQNPDQALEAIRLRTALKYPESLDITIEVLEEMSLPTE